jgi:hypothetical protein
MEYIGGWSLCYECHGYNGRMQCCVFQASRYAISLASVDIAFENEDSHLIVYGRPQGAEKYERQDDR